MLILSRLTGQSVMIGTDIVVTVLGVKGSQVRLGFKAPKEMRVDREEIFMRIQREKAAV